MARQIMAVELHDPGEPRHRKDHAKRKEREDGGEQANHERCISFRWRAGEHSRLRPRKFAGNSKTLTASTEDRKSTRLNSSHVAISYAVFCLKKKSRSTTTEV